MNRFFLSLFFPLAFAVAPFSAAAQVNKELPLVELKIDKHSLKAELANDNNTRMVGLMNRFSLKPDQGMLFVFPNSSMIGMWMKNTYIPLSVAFIDDKGVILNIEDMQPQSLETHATVSPALYALEMKKGWFAERGIKAGAKIQGLDKAGKAKDAS
jgi:uncharacterized protein